MKKRGRPKKPRDLFGDVIPTNEFDLVQMFVKEVKARGTGNFSTFRLRHKIESVSRHIGATVRAACSAAGLFPAGSDRAVLPESNGHLITRWCSPTPRRKGGRA